MKKNIWYVLSTLVLLLLSFVKVDLASAERSTTSHANCGFTATSTDKFDSDEIIKDIKDNLTRKGWQLKGGNVGNKDLAATIQVSYKIVKQENTRCEKSGMGILVKCQLQGSLVLNGQSSVITSATTESCINLKTESPQEACFALTDFKKAVIESVGKCQIKHETKNSSSPSGKVAGEISRLYPVHQYKLDTLNKSQFTFGKNTLSIVKAGEVRQLERTSSDPNEKKYSINLVLPSVSPDNSQKSRSLGDIFVTGNRIWLKGAYYTSNSRGDLLKSEETVEMYDLDSGIFLGRVSFSDKFEFVTYDGGYMEKNLSLPFSGFIFNDKYFFEYSIEGDNYLYVADPKTGTYSYHKLDGVGGETWATGANNNLYYSTKEAVFQYDVTKKKSSFFAKLNGCFCEQLVTDAETLFVKDGYLIHAFDILSKKLRGTLTTFTPTEVPVGSPFPSGASFKQTIFKHKQAIYVLNTAIFSPSRLGGTSINSLMAIDSRTGSKLWESLLFPNSTAFDDYQHMEVKGSKLDLVNASNESILNDYVIDLATGNKEPLMKQGQ